ncbi:PQQ-binding-like beta-propeller repeat protein [Actinoplanes sp. NPDC026619]|uniref:outer membrane protein assembly factor BamB family protein n=1 Tax=Actinoplanes sp. NPDC026619 TaxID=3155798 RepID=UPI00340FD1EC
MDRRAEVLWSRSLCLRSSATTVAARDVLVVAERHSRLVRLDPRTGALIWEQRVEDCWGTTAVTPGRCLYLSQRGVLHCFELQSGRPMWSRPGLPFHRYLSVSGSVIVLGGWRGYQPVTRIGLADGACDPFDSPYAPGESLAWPTVVRFPPDPDSAVGAVLLASASRPELRLEDPQTGTALGTWRLPAPVQFPDSGNAFHHSDDGRVVFVSGRRTVMSFHASTGVQALWEHERDLPPLAPVLIGGKLMLAEDSRITVVDLTRGGRTDITPLSPGTACAPVPTADGALFARSDGNLVMIDRNGNRADLRLPTRAEQSFTGDGTLAYVIGKGHLTALDVPAGER